MHLLSPFINFLYTGNLEINATNAVEVLEAVELLQLEGEHEVVRKEVSKVLEVELNQCTSLEALFPLWDTAVTFSLNCLLDRLLEIVAARIQLWTLSEKDVQWINRLGWEEMHQVWKNKKGICLKCSDTQLNEWLQYQQQLQICRLFFKNSGEDDLKIHRNVENIFGSTFILQQI